MNIYNIPFQLCMGHSKRVRHPSILPYLMPYKSPIDIFDPEKVVESIVAARSKIASTTGPIWWVGERKFAGVLRRFENPHVVFNRRWPAGSLTNFTANKHPFPQLVVVLSVHRHPGVIKEAQKMGVHVVGVVDSNSNTHGVDTPIFANDDGMATMQFLMDCLLPVK